MLFGEETGIETGNTWRKGRVSGEGPSERRQFGKHVKSVEGLGPTMKNVFLFFLFFPRVVNEWMSSKRTFPEEKNSQRVIFFSNEGGLNEIRKMRSSEFQGDILRQMVILL